MSLVQLPNIPIISDRVPNEIYDALIKESKEVFSNKDYLKTVDLAGHIKHEYKLPKSIKIAEPYILHLAKNLFPYLDSTTQKTNNIEKLQLGEMWVNFQKKHEFNPIHIHSGLFSFVIFMQVPFELNDEIEIFNANGDFTSRLQFIYANIVGKLSHFTIDVCKSDQKRILFFPANLNHTVYPFYTSDGYRVTISGNVYG